MSRKCCLLRDQPNLHSSPNTTTTTRSCPKPRRCSARWKSFLPNTSQDHHVSFQPCDNYGYIYSEKQIPFERRFPTDKSWLQFVGDKARSGNENRQFLEETVEFLTNGKRQTLADCSVPRKIDPHVHRTIQDRPLEVQAAILSYFIRTSSSTPNSLLLSHKMPRARK